MKKLFLLIFIIIISGILWIVGFPFPYLLNNYRLNSFSDQLKEIPLPPQTKRIGPAIRKFGNLGPCSKHGDYYAEFRIFSSLPYAQLKNFYSQYCVQVPEINNFFSSQFRGMGTHGPIAVKIEKLEKTKSTYLIFADDPGYWHNDFRCW